MVSNFHKLSTFCYFGRKYPYFFFQFSFRFGPAFTIASITFSSSFLGNEKLLSFLATHLTISRGCLLAIPVVSCCSEKQSLHLQGLGLSLAFAIYSVRASNFRRQILDSGRGALIPVEGRHVLDFQYFVVEIQYFVVEGMRAIM